MACCNKSETTQVEFLIQKGKNFKEFIMKYKPDNEVVEYMGQFDEKNVLKSVLTLLIPLKASGTQKTAINELMSKLNVPASEVEAVKDKIGRYFDMFVEVVLSTSS